MEHKGLIITIVATLLLVVAGAFGYNRFAQPRVDDGGMYDALATCIAASGAHFYGAFWCPHCQNQKHAFGSSANKLPYVECSTPDGQQQTEACAQAGVQSYPTWVFANGDRLTGEIAMRTLAEKTGCTLPGETADPLPIVGTSTAGTTTGESVPAEKAPAQ